MTLSRDIGRINERDFSPRSYPFKKSLENSHGRVGHLSNSCEVLV